MTNANKQRDEEAIRKVEAAYDQAWRNGDVENVVACLTKDALLVNPRGEVASGHDEIRNLLSEFLSGPAKGSKHTSRITRIVFITNDVAVVDGEAVIEGMDSVESSTLTHRFTDILVRTEGGWLISQVRAYANY